MGEEGAACATMGAVTGGGEVSPLGSSCFDESSLAGSVGTANSLSSPYRSIFLRQKQEECKMKSEAHRHRGRHRGRTCRE